MSAGSLPASRAPASHSDLNFFQVNGSVTSPSPCCPARRMDFLPFAGSSAGSAVTAGHKAWHQPCSTCRDGRRAVPITAAEDVDGRDQLVPTFGPVRPGALLIKRLARTDPEKYPAGMKQTQRGEPLGYHHRVIAQCWTCHRRADPGGLRFPSQRIQCYPRLTRVPLIRLPWLQIVSRGEQAEPGARRLSAQLDQFGNRELLVGRACNPASVCL